MINAFNADSKVLGPQSFKEGARKEKIIVGIISVKLWVIIIVIPIRIRL